jgi:hypothetical protein
MKRFTKQLVAVLIILTMVLSGTATAFAADSTGIQVQYNGANLVLADAAKNVNGRVMLPFREVLEGIGADVSYDPATKIITAKTADREITFSVGSSEVTIVQNGVSKTVKMDVAPYLDKSLSRTYVPVRFVAESLGYSVGWDSEAKTVIIIDPNTLFANADTDFAIISKLLKTDLDLEKSYASTGKFAMNMTSYEASGSFLSNLNFDMSGTMTGVQQKSNADMDMKLALNFDKMLSTLTAEEKTQIEPFLAMYKNADMKVKMNGDTGDMYMNSSLFSAMDPTVNANTWYKMNAYDTYENMGIDLKSLTGMSMNNMKVSDMLAASFSSQQYFTVSTYEDTKMGYELIKSLIGDDAFKKSTNGSITTYTLNLNQASVLAAITKTALSNGLTTDTFNMTDLGSLLDGTQVSSTIVIKEKAGSLYNYSVKGSAVVEDATCSLDMSGDQMNVACNVTFDQKDVMKMIIDVESHIKESATAPDLTLPANAVVVDYPVVPAY